MWRPWSKSQPTGRVSECSLMSAHVCTDGVPKKMYEDACRQRKGELLVINGEGESAIEQQRCETKNQRWCKCGRAGVCACLLSSSAPKALLDAPPLALWDIYGRGSAHYIFWLQIQLPLPPWVSLFVHSPELMRSEERAVESR